MNRLLGAELAAQQFVGAVGDHLIQIHVGLGAGSGLPHHQRKLIVELAVDHLARGADDGAGPALVEQTQFAVGFGGGELDDAERANDRHRHPVMADAEILPRTFGLRAPVPVGGNLDRTETVGLGAGGWGSRCRGRAGHPSYPLCKAARSHPAHAGAPQRHIDCTEPQDFARADYFLRKRSSRTTSAPSLGLAGGLGSSVAGSGTVNAKGTGEGAVTAGNFAAGSSGAASAASNCRPNCTDGSKKLLMELNGTTSRSGMPPNDSPTSKRSSVTVRSQNWCCRITVISSGYCASSRGDSLTPSAVDRKVMKK